MSLPCVSSHNAAPAAQPSVLTLVYWGPAARRPGEVDGLLVCPVFSHTLLHQLRSVLTRVYWEPPARRPGEVDGCEFTLCFLTLLQQLDSQVC